MNIIKYRKIWYVISGLFILASVFSVGYFGLNWGIDFTGGSLVEIEYQVQRPDISIIKQELKGLGIGNAVVQPSGEKGLIIRSRNLSDEEHQKLLAALRSGTSGQKPQSENRLTELRFDSIGPVIGKELRQKSWIAIALVVLMIILYIAFVFRGVSRPVSSFKYGLVAIVALFHDVIIPLGAFAVLGKYFGAEVDVLFITALLTILGFSVHDTIVVFDRVRENLHKKISPSFEEVVGKSVTQTITRSINTSLTVLLVLGAVFFFGGETTKFFSLALIIGVAIGTYSSVFLASPLLVTIYKFQERRK